MSGSAAQSANAKKKQRQRAKAAAVKAAAGSGDTPSSSAPETATAGKAVKGDEEELQPSAPAETESSIGAPATTQATATHNSELDDAAAVSETREKGHSGSEGRPAMSQSVPEQEPLSTPPETFVEDGAETEAQGAHRASAMTAPAAVEPETADTKPEDVGEHGATAVPDRLPEAKDDIDDLESEALAPASGTTDGQLSTEKQPFTLTAVDKQSETHQVIDPENKPTDATEAEPTPVTSHAEDSSSAADAPRHDIPSTSAKKLFKGADGDDDPFSSVSAEHGTEPAVDSRQAAPEDAMSAEPAPSGDAPPRPAASAIFAEASAEIDPFAEIEHEDDHVQDTPAQAAGQDQTMAQAQSPRASLGAQRDVPQQAASHLFSMDGEDDAFGQIGGQEDGLAAPADTPAGTAEHQRASPAAPVAVGASDPFGGNDDEHDDFFATTRGDDDDPISQMDVGAEAQQGNGDRLAGGQNEASGTPAHPADLFDDDSGDDPFATIRADESGPVPRSNVDGDHPAGLFGEVGGDDPFAAIGGQDDTPAPTVEATYDGKFDDLLAEFEEYADTPAEPTPALQPIGGHEAQDAAGPTEAQAEQEMDHVGDASMRSMFTDGGDWLADTSIDDSFDLGAIRGEDSLEPESPIAGDFLDRTPPSRKQPLAPMESESGAELIEPVIPEGWFNDQGEFVYYTTEEKEAVKRALLGESEGQTPETGTGLTGFGGLRTSQSENSARRTPILPEPAQQLQPSLTSGAYDPYAPAPTTKPAQINSAYSPYSAPAYSAPTAPYGQPATAYNPSPYDPYAPAPQPFQAFGGAGPSQRSVSAAPTSTSAKPAAAPPPKPQRIVSNAYDPPLRPSKSFVRAPSAAVAVTSFTPPPVPALSPPPAPPSAPPTGPPKRAKTPAAAPPPSVAGPPKGPSAIRQPSGPPPGPPSTQPHARADDAYAPAPACPPPIAAEGSAQLAPSRPPSAAASAKPAFTSFDPPMRPPSAAKMGSRAPSRLTFSPPPANLGMTPAGPPPSRPIASVEASAPPPQRLEPPAHQPHRSDRPISRNPSGMFEPPPPQRPPSQPAFEAPPPQRPSSRPSYEAPPPQQPPPRPAFEAAPPQRPSSRPAFSPAPPPRPPSAQQGPPSRSASPMTFAAPPPAMPPVMQVSKREEDAWRGGYENEDEEEVQPGAEEEDWREERTAAAQALDGEEDMDDETGDVSTVSREARRSTGGSDSLEASFSGLSLASRDEPYPPQRPSDGYGPPSHAPPPPQQVYSPPRAPARPEQQTYEPYQPTPSYQPGPPAHVAPYSDPYAPQTAVSRTSTDSYNPYAPPPGTKPRSGSVQQAQPPSTFSPAMTVMQMPRNDPYARMTPPPAGSAADYGTSPAAPNYFRSMEAAEPSDPTYVPQQILEQRPVSEDSLGRSAPAARNVPLAVFGFGGVLITCFPGASTADGGSSAGYSHSRAPSYGYASGSNRLFIRPIADVVPSAALKSNEAVFPGPLVLDSSAPKGAAGEKKRREAVTAYLSARAQEIEQGLPYLKSAASAARREQEGKLVIVRLLAAMILGEGKLSGNPQVEEAVRAALSDPSTMSSRPMLSPTSLVPPNLSSQHYGSSRSFGSTAPTAVTASASQLTHLSEMIMAGDKRGAAENAAAQTLWSHALVIASSAGPDAWKEVVGRFVAAELGHHSHAAGLKAAYTLYSGRMADSVDDLMAAANITSDPSNDRWRDVLSAVVFNSTPPQLACLDELGHKLMSAGLVNAAQACFILSPSSPFGIVTHAAFDKPILLTKGINDEDAIIFAEIAEYARSMITVPKGQEAPFPGLPQLLPYKLQRAWVAAEQGDGELAKRYCHAVDAASKIGKNGPTVLPGHLVASLEDLLERLTGTPTIDPKKTFAGRKASSKPALDSFGSWIEGRLTKFIAGEEDASGASGASAPPPPSLNKNAKAEVRVGPFSHFSTISPALTEASRNPSLLDMSTAGGHLGLPSRQTSPFPGQAPPQRAAPISIRESATTYPADQQGSSWDSWRGGDQAAMNDAQTASTQAEGEDVAAEGDEYEGEFINPMAGFSLNTIAPTPPADNYAPPAASAPRDHADEEDDDDLGFGNNALKPKSKPAQADSTGTKDNAPAKPGKSDSPAAATAATPAAANAAAPGADPSQPAAQEKKGWFGGWLGGGKKKGADAPASGPVRAKLGEENSMVFDPVQKRWVVKGAKGEATPPATPPPPPRAQTASPAGAGAARPPQPTHPSSAGPPSAPSSAPPSARPPGFAEGADGGIRRMKSSLAESVTASDVTPPGPPSGGSAGGPPSRAATAAPGAAPGAALAGVKPPSLDDLLSRPPSKRPGSVASRKGAKNRYVDVFQQ